MRKALVITATVFAVLAAALLIVMAAAELNPDAASLFGMYPF